LLAFLLINLEKETSSQGVPQRLLKAVQASRIYNENSMEAQEAQEARECAQRPCEPSEPTERNFREAQEAVKAHRATSRICYVLDNPGICYVLPQPTHLTTTTLTGVWFRTTRTLWLRFWKKGDDMTCGWGTSLIE
jgi:hypothetical protein